MRQVVYNTELGGFSLPTEALHKYALRKYGARQITNLDDLESFTSCIKLSSGEVIYDCDIPRHDPILVQVVKELRLEETSSLRICEVEGKYYIEDYDGSETVLDSAKLTEENGWY